MNLPCLRYYIWFSAHRNTNDLQNIIIIIASTRGDGRYSRCTYESHERSQTDRSKPKTRCKLALTPCQAGVLYFWAPIITDCLCVCLVMLFSSESLVLANSHSLFLSFSRNMFVSKGKPSVKPVLNCEQIVHVI